MGAGAALFAGGALVAICIAAIIAVVSFVTHGCAA
jgi:hypothetical protein